MFKAIIIISSLFAIYPRLMSQNPEYWIQKGIESHSSLEFKSASLYFNKAIELDPDNAIGYNLLGQSLMAEKKYFLAIDAFTKAIYITPTRAILYCNRGLAYQCVDQHEKALEDFKYSIHLNPNYDVAHYNCGISNSALKNYPEALLNLNQAILLNSCKETYYNQRGKTRFLLQKYEQALSDFSQAVACNPLFGNAHYNKALSYSKVGKIQESISSFEIAILTNPSEPKYYVSRGVAYLRLRKYSDAILDFDKAIDLDPLSANAYLYKGLTLKKLGRNEEALVVLKHATDLGSICLEGLPNPFLDNEKPSDINNSKVWPVSIGIGNYDPNTKIDYKLDALCNSEPCADQFLSIFKPYTDDDVNLKSLVRSTATYNGIINCLDSLSRFSTIKPNDIVLVFFSGHGFSVLDQSGEEAVVLLAYDSYSPGEFITEQKIIDKIKDLPAKHKVLFIEACRSREKINQHHPDRTTLRAKEPSDIQIRNITENREALPPGLVVIRSSQLGQDSFEYPTGNNEYASFSSFLINGLNGAADEDGDNFITVGEIFKHIKTEFSNLDFKDKQIPTISIDDQDPAWNLKLLALPESIQDPNKPVD